jgi:hypothetical protein
MFPSLVNFKSFMSLYCWNNDYIEPVRYLLPEESSVESGIICHKCSKMLIRCVVTFIQNTKPLSMCKLLKAKEGKDSSENWPISNFFGSSTSHG